MIKMIQNKLPNLVVVFICVTTLFLLMNSFKYFFKTEKITEISSVTVSYNGTEQATSLPTTLKELSAGTEVTVSFSVAGNDGHTLFFGSVYSPLSIYADDVRIYSYGDPDNYSSFLQDPPTQYDSIDIPYSKNSNIRIKMVYLSPSERSSLSIHAPLLGDQSTIRQYLIREYGLSLIVSALFISFGLVLIFGSFFFIRTDISWQILYYPGVFTLCTGSWQFGENTLSVYTFQNPTLLYFMDFSGLFLLAIPLYKLAMIYLGHKKSRVLRIGLYLMEAAVIVTLILQLTGTASFHKTLYLFHILAPLAIIQINIYSLYIAVTTQSKNAKIFSLAFLVLSLAAILELLNYHFHFITGYSLIFQYGVFAFTLILCIIATSYLKQLLIERRKKQSWKTSSKYRNSSLIIKKTRWSFFSPSWMRSGNTGMICGTIFIPFPN